MRPVHLLHGPVLQEHGQYGHDDTGSNISSGRKIDQLLMNKIPSKFNNFPHWQFDPNMDWKTPLHGTPDVMLKTKLLTKASFFRHRLGQD